MTISLQEPLWNRSLAYMAECLRQGFIQKWPTYVEEDWRHICLEIVCKCSGEKYTKGLGGGDADQRERKSLQTAAAFS